jgi:hypothetical protein
MVDWYLIKNDKGLVCNPKKGGCGKVHEYWTKDCRPVAFDKPLEWEIFKIEKVQDRGITLVADETTFITSRLGPVERITEQEAIALNCIKNPPSLFRRSISFPSSPTRREEGGTQAFMVTDLNHGGKKWR